MGSRETNPIPKAQDPSYQWRCATCAAGLSWTESADPATGCLSCPSGHRYYRPGRPAPSEATAQASRLELDTLAGASPERVARFWLSDTRARAHLNSQLAELLRVFLEQRCAESDFRLKYCPSCGSQLSGYEQPDIWVAGLRCPNGHDWAERGRRLWTTIDGILVEIEAEPSSSVVASLVTAWLSGNPHLESNLHVSVRRVLESLIRQHSTDVLPDPPNPPS